MIIKKKEEKGKSKIQKKVVLDSDYSDKKKVVKERDEKVILKLVEVWKTYYMGDNVINALKNVNLEINEGEFVAILGQSGSGKSTMMNLIGCLDVPSKGDIFLEDYNINELSESDLATLRGYKIGFIFQQYNLIQSMSAYDNVMLPLELLEFDEDEAKERALGILDKLGLGDKILNRPNQLSGGQQQRVSIGRCLASNPDIILADEPTGALDSKTGIEIMGLLQQLWKDDGKTIIMVTHDLKLADYAQKVIELRDGEIIDIRINKSVKMAVSSD